MQTRSRSSETRLLDVVLLFWFWFCIMLMLFFVAVGVIFIYGNRREKKWSKRGTIQRREGSFSCNFHAFILKEKKYFDY